MRRLLLATAALSLAGLMACGDSTSGGGTPAPGPSGGTPKETPKDTPKAFVYSEWDAWDAATDGSSVTMEMTAAGNTNKMKTTRVKKDGETITVETKMIMEGMDIPATPREIKKPAAAGTAPTECPMCKKPIADHKKPEVKESKESAKVGDKDVDCTVVESKAFDCEGKEVSWSKFWYAKDIPGGVARMEMKAGGMETSQKAIAFEKK